jgi:hypothetical protein
MVWGQSPDRQTVSPANFLDWRAQSESFEGLALANFFQVLSRSRWKSSSPVEESGEAAPFPSGVPDFPGGSEREV